MSATAPPAERSKTLLVVFEAQDLELGRAVVACHATQLRKGQVADLAESMGERFGGRVSFRSWVGLVSGDDILAGASE